MRARAASQSRYSRETRATLPRLSLFPIPSSVRASAPHQAADSLHTSAACPTIARYVADETPRAPPHPAAPSSLHHSASHTTSQHPPPPVPTHESRHDATHRAHYVYRASTALARSPVSPSQSFPRTKLPHHLRHITML